MFGCVRGIQCDVRAYCFHGDVFEQSIHSETGYPILPGLSLFALTAAPLLDSWQNVPSHCSSRALFDILDCIYCLDL